MVGRSYCVPPRSTTPELPDPKPAEDNRGSFESTHVLRAAEGDAGDAGDASEVQLLHELASLLLVAGVDHGLGASGDAGITSLDVGLIAGVIVELLNLGVLGLVLRGELLDSGVGHFES